MNRKVAYRAVRLVFGVIALVALANVSCSRRATPGAAGDPPAAMAPEPPKPTATRFKLTVIPGGSGKGSVSGGPIDCNTTCAADIDAGTSLVLTAGVAEGSRLAAWSVAGCGGLTCTILADRDLVVTVTFELVPSPTPPPLPPPPTPVPGFCSIDHWCWENPTPQGNPISSLWTSAPDDVWAAGAAGTVLHHDGTRWARMTIDGEEDLNAIWGSSHDDVWAAGEGGAIHHFDGAKWSRVDGGTSAALYSIRGTRADDIWAAGAAGTLLRFDGIRWTTLPKPRDADLSAVWPFAGGEIWLAVGRQPGGSGEVLRGDGTNWLIERTGAPSFAMWASGPTDVWVAGVMFPGKAAHWNGRTWTETDVLEWNECAPYGFSSLWGFSAGRPWLICASGSITRFDGSAWMPPLPLTSGLGTAPSVIGGTDPDNAWLASDNGAVGRLSNVGLDPMHSEMFPTISPLGTVWASGPSDVWVGGVNSGGAGVCAHFDGRAWTRVALPAPSGAFEPEVSGIWGTGPSDVWAVGWLELADRSYEPRTWHYDGSRWSVVTALAGVQFTHVSGTSKDDVWLYGSEYWLTFFGAKESVRHWNGQHWETVDYPYYKPPLWITPVGDAWVAYTWCSQWDYVSRICMRSTGTIEQVAGLGRSSWNGNWAVSAIWGQSSVDLWAVGGFTDGPGGLIAHRSEAGWAKVDIAVPEQLHAISGSGANDVWAVGEHGAVLHFDGQQWTRERSGAARPLGAVFALPDGDVLAVGTRGTILRQARNLSRR